jgi:hypothetical protein
MYQHMCQHKAHWVDVLHVHQMARGVDNCSCTVK